MDVKNKVKTFIQILFCSSFFVYILYLRLFRWGQIREISTNLLLNENYLRMVIIIGIIISLVIALYLQFRSLYEIESKGFFKFQFIIGIVEAVENAFLTFFRLLGWFIGKCGFRYHHFVTFGLFFDRLCSRTLVKLELFMYMIHIIPKFLYTIVFIADVFVFHELYYAFAWSGLLLIPFFVKFVEKFYDFFSKSLLEDVNDMLWFKDVKTGQYYTTQELFCVIQEADLAGVMRPLGNICLILKPEHIVELQASIADIPNSDDFILNQEAQLLEYSHQYFEKLVPLRQFVILYNTIKWDITNYSNILFTVSYIIIWSSLLWMTL